MGFEVMNKNATAFTGNFFVAVLETFVMTFDQGHTAADTLAFGKEPGLDGRNDVFEHLLSSCLI